MTYRAPVSDIQFLLDHVVGYDQIAATERFAEADADVAAIEINIAFRFLIAADDDFHIKRLTLPNLRRRVDSRELHFGIAANRQRHGVDRDSTFSDCRQ